MLGEKLAELVSFFGEDKAKALSVHSAIESDFHDCHLVIIAKFAQFREIMAILYHLPAGLARHVFKVSDRIYKWPGI